MSQKAASAQLCFGSTYEGLKLVLRIAEALSIDRFGSTYEGLKPVSTTRCAGQLLTFWQYL